ncbi:hypothetical protein ACIBKZ_33900 [Streptomyces sp. NPDC050421]|uniref:hypothetical protein n=1 Tax=unclassified Streptomyces TaxID=2593676 RepID=UPI0037922A2A
MDVDPVDGAEGTVRTAARAGAEIPADVFPGTGLTPATGWNAGSAGAPFSRYTYRLGAAPAAPQIAPAGTGQWRITSDCAAFADLADAQLVLDYRGGVANLVGAGATLTNDLYHGEPWTVDLKNLDDAARADLLLQVRRGTPRSTAPLSRPAPRRPCRHGPGTRAARSPGPDRSGFPRPRRASCS